MQFKNQKPITAGQRHLIRLNNQHFNKPLIKQKIKKLTKMAGRNNSGKLTVRHKGGGHKQRYREIEFFRNQERTAIIIGIEHDPNRTAFIASAYDIKSKTFFYILAPKNIKIGDIIKSGINGEIKIGHALPLKNIPLGSYVHNISLRETKPGQLARSAGTFGRIREKTLSYIKLELSSGALKFVSPSCYATIGIVSNELKFLTRSGKAGRSRWLNIRPTVRGVAMNPVDHPHGGGEGKKSGNGKTPWGRPVKQAKQRK